jgi:hypothetical protein
VTGLGWAVVFALLCYALLSVVLIWAWPWVWPVVAIGWAAFVGLCVMAIVSQP